MFQALPVKYLELELSRKAILLNFETNSVNIALLLIFIQLFRRKGFAIPNRKIAQILCQVF